MNDLFSRTGSSPATAKLQIPRIVGEDDLAGIASPESGEVEHMFTVDVEEYFHVSAMSGVVPRSEWRSRESRVRVGISILLELLAEHRAHATFFTLGWVASAQRALVRQIAAEGHEIASHGWGHDRVTVLSPAEFREDVRRSKGLLEDITGRRVIGYRAPSFSILPGLEWAFDILLEEGYLYDSSLFPITRSGYGYPQAASTRHPIERTPGTILELPMTILPFGGVRIPASGGAYFRHFPYALTRMAFQRFQAKGVAAVFYIHPWELDAAQPRVPVNFLTRIRHYRGIPQVLPRLHRLLSDFRFTSVNRCIPQLAGFGFPEIAPARGGPAATPAERALPTNLLRVSPP